ncbi:MAG: hypothetical protein KJ630_07030 [Proteobacteria bacterium]|nr:hypothetical protein [Pseudomonadota bacterium]
MTKKDDKEQKISSDSCKEVKVDYDSSPEKKKEEDNFYSLFEKIVDYNPTDVEKRNDLK